MILDRITKKLNNTPSNQKFTIVLSIATTLWYFVIKLRLFKIPYD